MGNCAGCVQDQREDLSTSQVELKTNEDFYYRGPEKNPNGISISQSYSEDVMSKEPEIIKFQSLWRGHQARKELAAKQNFNRSEITDSFIQLNLYFTKEECFETVKNTSPSKVKELQPPYKYQSGAVYMGQWKGGFRDGVGTMIWPDGATYQGQWVLGKADGYGRFIHINGDTYSGLWCNDKAKGWGAYQKQENLELNKPQMVLEGFFKEDQQNGFGIVIIPKEGSKFEGYFVNGQKHGWGIFTWTDGSCLEGEWAKGKLTGNGYYKWSDGRTYQGQWCEQKLHGIGIYKWNDGKAYEGEYQMDKKEGYGVYDLNDGRRYEGWWQNGKQHGLGNYFFEDQKTSERKSKKGIWEDGKRTRWLEEKEIESIRQEQIDFRIFMQKQENISRPLVSEGANSFEEPTDLQQRFKELIQDIEFQSTKLAKDRDWALQRISDTKDRVEELLQEAEKLASSNKN